MAERVIKRRNLGLRKKEKETLGRCRDLPDMEEAGK